MVSFQPSEEQQLIRDTVAAFAKEQVRPRAHEADETGQVPSDVVQQGWELGLVLSAIPEAYGGAGDTHSAVTGALLTEELAWGDLSIALHLLAPRLVAYPVLEMGTPEQKERILAAYTGAQFCPGTAAVVEPRFDFDLAAIEYHRRAQQRIIRARTAPSALCRSAPRPHTSWSTPDRRTRGYDGSGFLLAGRRPG